MAFRTQSEELKSSRAYRSDTQLAPDDRRHLSAEDFYGVQHFLVWQRGDTHLGCDARNATRYFIHVKDLFTYRYSFADPHWNVRAAACGKLDYVWWSAAELPAT